jgi:hypothetical protein
MIDIIVRQNMIKPVFLFEEFHICHPKYVSSPKKTTPPVTWPLGNE